ncbi:MAG: peptidoglycan DD-metalloendopeptidase family protein [Candidatus Onthomonas sp.]
MQQCPSPSRRFLPGRVLSLILALMFALALLSGQALAIEVEEGGGPTEGIILTVEELNEPDYDSNFFYLLIGQRYYLSLEGQLLVTADNPEVLIQLVRTAAEAYVTEDTVSCALADPEQLTLCYGYVTFGASDDLEAAAQALSEQLQVITVMEAVRNEVAPYAQVRAEDPERYEDEEPVVTPGSDGLNRVTWEVTCLNGEFQNAEVVDTQVLTEAVDEVTTVGTKERPEYIWPAAGRISSKFGPRNIAIGSKNHKGIDIAVSYGSDIVAAKAGTVIYAQWNSSGYGYLVKIEHEDGDVTYYAHNSSLVVKKGDYVEQGQVIAKAGSTGRSSGTHCHFEIRVDGTPVDPLDYLES